MIDAASLNKKGADHFIEGDFEGARLYYLASLKADPLYIPAMINLATLLGNNNNLQPAKVLFSRITELRPDDGNAWNSYGNILMRLEKYDEAAQAFDKAEKFIPESSAFWHNRALLNCRVHNFTGALRCLEKVEALGGFSLAVQNDIAHVMLGMGRLSEALTLYEARWASLIHLEPWDFYIPEWKGENLEGKSILFHAEQGFGDSIMTARFAENLKNLGANVTIGLPPGLVRLFESQGWDCIDISQMNVEDAERFNFHSPMYSAMRYLGIEIDSIKSDKYITAPDITVPPVYSGHAFNVGICWGSGKRGGQQDWRRRYAPLEYWLQLADMPEVQLWSLQKGEDSLDIGRIGAEALINDCTPKFEDWADTAAFINQLDLIISVDTAVVHLAGAMGKPVWMLTQYNSCWRWWNIGEGNGKPWYETVAIITQDDPGDWSFQLDLAAQWLKDDIKNLRNKRAVA